jgi:hypothetical protein
VGGAGHQRAHAADFHRRAERFVSERCRNAADRHQLSDRDTGLRATGIVNDVATAPAIGWQFNDIIGSNEEGGTTLRHLTCEAELSVRAGRLVAGPGYRTAPAESRRALARVGAILRLRERGYFYIHTAGVVDPTGRAWLLCGASGAGKSTLAYALARRGWRVLGDDGVIINTGSSRGDAIVAYGWRDPVRVAVGAQGLFPELRTPSQGESAWRTLDGDVRNRAEIAPLFARQAYVTAIIWVAQGHVTSHSSVSSRSALTWLIAQSAWVLFGDAHTSSHLAALSALARLPQFQVTHPADRLAAADETLLSLI